MIKTLPKLFLGGLIIILFSFLPYLKATAQTTTAAGIGAQIIITASSGGLGTGPNASNYVELVSADVGGNYVALSASNYVSWTDTQITFKVPSGAGSGILGVVLNNVAYSAGQLNISWNILNATSGDGIDHILVINNRDNTGGVTFHFSSEFNSNANAVQAFTRALNTWKCTSNVHWTIGANTDINQVAADGVDVVRFANADDDLDDNILGQTATFWNSKDGIRWEVIASDITFNATATANFNYTNAAPGSTQYDFESVALHELGHAHLLGHVIDQTDVMNAFSTPGLPVRTLNANNIAAANFVMSKSTAAASTYFYPPMVAFASGSCSLCTAVTLGPQPADQAVNEGHAASFTANASAGTSVTYQWEFSTDGGNNWNSVPASSPYQNPTAPMLTINPTSLAMNGYKYRCHLTNSCSTVFTNAVTLTVNPNLSTNANLAGLTLSTGTLTPAFNASTTSYTASVANSVAAINITPTVSDATATIKVNGAAVTSGSPASVALAVGANTVTVAVTAQDGVTIKNYVVTVTKAAAASNNALLTSIKINPATGLTTTTGPGYANYTTSVPSTETSLTVTATHQDANSTIKINGTTVASGVASAAIPLSVGNNVIATVVTAQDGVTTKTYIITATRAQPPVTTLNNLAISAGSLSPVFAAATINYTAVVPNATSSVKITPTVTDASATVKVNGTTVASGAASASIALNVGSNTITTVVTAQDGTATTTYTIMVTRAAAGLSTNAVLTSIKINPSTGLTTTTGPGYANYTTAVPYTETSLTVTATHQDANSTIKVNGVTVASGTASAAIPLSVGANAITTVVTAQDGATTKTYIITATRAQPPVTTLDNLAISAGTLSPVFAAATINYTAIVPNATSTIKVTPTVTSATTTVKVNGTAVASGAASANIPLTVGDNTLTTVVTAQDGITATTYTITVTRAAAGLSTNALLTSIKINPATGLTTVSGPGYANYTTTVPFTQTSLTVTATHQDANSTIKVNGISVASGTASAAIPLSVGNNTITTVVTAQDGATTKTYIITAVRAAGSSVATLSNLSLSTGTLNPVFAASTNNYTAIVPNTTSAINVTPTVTDATAAIKVNGTTVASGAASANIALTVGDNTITTVVTAQDGTTTQTYTVTVTRAAAGLSTNAILTSIKITPSTGLTSVSGPGYANYTTSVPNSETSLTVTATHQDANSTIKINGISVVSGTPSPAIPLSVGDNVITTVVTAQDGATTKTYVITATRAVSGMFAQYEVAPVINPRADGITVHQGLSPNGDGDNDVLTIDGITNYPDNTLQVMNRSGELVYQVKGYDNRSKVFDGQSNVNGKLQPAGTYFYSLDYKDGNETKHKTGFIVLKY